MKLYHISDLHIGRQLHGYRLTDVQRKVLKEIVRQVEQGHPDVLLIAGDIYDKSVPSGDAFLLLDEFFTALSKITPQIPVLVIAGNHDNEKKLQFAASFLEEKQIYIAAMPPRTEDEHLKRVTLWDEWGPVHFYLMPFLRPADVRNLFPEKNLENYEDAVRAVLERETVNEKERNVLLAHQFFVSRKSGEEILRSESESYFAGIGGIDSVDVELVKNFDYVALGHIHGAQKAGYEHVRYSGTPYKYSVSEEHQKKGITVVELKEKGQENQYGRILLPVSPDVRRRKGTLAELLQNISEKCTDYVELTVLDEDVYRPKDLLKEKYTNILEVKIENQRTRKQLELEESREEMNPLEAFCQFYEEMNGVLLTERESREMEDVIHTCSICEEEI